MGFRRFTARRLAHPARLLAGLCFVLVLSCLVWLFHAGAFDSKTDAAVRNISNCTGVRLPSDARVLSAQTDNPSFIGDFSGNLTADVPSRSVERMRANAQLPEFSPGLPSWLTIEDLGNRWQRQHDPDLARLPDDSTFRHTADGEEETEPRWLLARPINTSTTRIYLSVRCF